ncbi:MAG TPA: hypothetical protein VJ870_19855 [Amycolatopsis sp.]|nr:hypothetical protein [Amycolatopsis sp.]
MNADDNMDAALISTVLERAVGTEPELGFRAEDVLRRAHRGMARRRVAFTGLLTVVALVASVLLFNQVRSPRSSEPAAGTSSPSTRPAVGNSTVHGAGGPLVIDARSRELTAALATQNIVPPGVTIAGGESYGGQPLVFYKITVGTQYLNDYYAQAELRDSHGTGHFFVRIEQHPDGISCVATGNTCVTQDLPDGSHLTAYRHAQPPVGDAKYGTIQWIVELVRPDGTAVQAASGNWSISGDPASGGISNPTGAEPPIGKDALIRLVEFPAMNF